MFSFFSFSLISKGMWTYFNVGKVYNLHFELKLKKQWHGFSLDILLSVALLLYSSVFFKTRSFTDIRSCEKNLVTEFFM